MIIHDHHIIKDSKRVITLDKLSSTEIYSILTSKVQNKPCSNLYFKNLFKNYNIDWTAIYLLPRFVTYNTNMRSSRYKILNNVLFLGKKPYTFGIKPSLPRYFCNWYDETPFHFHIFYKWYRVKCLWSDLVQCFSWNPEILKKEVALTSSMETIAFTKKWHMINNIVPYRRWIVLAQQIFEKKQVNYFW